jgi:uncharacterized protein (DUF2236 family)
MAGVPVTRELDGGGCPVGVPDPFGVLSAAARLARDRVARATNKLFDHGPHPLESTLNYPGDPGLFGPDSATWRVVGDTAVFVGGIRALIVQAAHPEVVAGVADHSQYREDPLGRLSRTAAYVTATSFGAMPEVDSAVETVRRRHRTVSGFSHRGDRYDASDPALAAWVHNSLTDSFLTAYLTYGAGTGRNDLSDLFVFEQTRVGALLGADPLPRTAEELSRWIADLPEIGASPGQKDAVQFLRRPPLPLAVRPVYEILFRAAAATVPERIRRIVGVHSCPGDTQTGRAAVGLLRSMLGASPDWQVALVRTGAAAPRDVRFRQVPKTQSL